MTSIELVARDGRSIVLQPIKMADGVEGVAFAYKDKAGILFVSVSQTYGTMETETWRIGRNGSGITEGEKIPATLNGQSLRIDRRFVICGGRPGIDFRRAYRLQTNE